VDGSSSREVTPALRPRGPGRPSTVELRAPQVAQWLREDPDLSGVEILRRVRLAGYRGGKCDRWPCALIATSVLRLAPRRAQPAGAQRGPRSRGSWRRPRRRVIRGAVTRRNGPTARRRWFGSSLSSQAIARISTSISSEGSPGTGRFECSSIAASSHDGHGPEPMRPTGATLIAGCPRRSTRYYARLAGPSCPWRSQRIIIETLPSRDRRRGW
jgi:hypothetical protein